MEMGGGGRVAPNPAKPTEYASAADHQPVLPSRDSAPGRPSPREPAGLPGRQVSLGRAFVSYVREDARRVDQLQQALETAGIPVWRDTADLWPGEDWQAKIRQAITANALVFIACFSGRALPATGASRTRNWSWRSNNCGCGDQTTLGSARSGSMNVSYRTGISVVAAPSPRSSASTCSMIAQTRNSRG
jgi:hypothetical protein